MLQRNNHGPLVQTLVNLQWLRHFIKTIYKMKERRKERRKEMFYLTTHSQQRQDNTYHGFCYTSCGALAGTRNSSTGPP